MATDTNNNIVAADAGNVVAIGTDTALTPVQATDTNDDMVVVDTDVVIDGNTTVADYAAKINAATAAAEASARSMVEHAVAAGRLLNIAKGRIAYGAFEAWLTDNIAAAPRTCRAYMRLAAQFDLLPDEDRQRVADLPIREALRAITTSPVAPVAKNVNAKPETPPPSPRASSRGWVEVKPADMNRALAALSKSSMVTRAFLRRARRNPRWVRASEIATLKKKMSAVMAAIDQLDELTTTTVDAGTAE